MTYRKEEKVINAGLDIIMEKLVQEHGSCSGETWKIWKKLKFQKSQRKVGKV